jgi:hypothetical protein
MSLIGPHITEEIIDSVTLNRGVFQWAMIEHQLSINLDYGISLIEKYEQFSCIKSIPISNMTPDTANKIIDMILRNKHKFGVVQNRQVVSFVRKYLLPYANMMYLQALFDYDRNFSDQERTAYVRSSLLRSDQA